MFVFITNLAIHMNHILPPGIATTYSKLQYFTSKLHRTASSIGFIKKALWLRVTPTFAKVKGNFANEKHRYSAVQKILQTSLQEHQRKLQDTSTILHNLKQHIIHSYSNGVFTWLYRLALRGNKEARLASFYTKNKKLSNLSSTQNNNVNYSVPIINLTEKNIEDSVRHYLRYGLNHSFVDKNRYVKLNLATEMEFLFNQVKTTIPDEQQENL